jgi:hypothetical protein
MTSQTASVHMGAMSIKIRDIANDSLVGLSPELAGLPIQTDFTDTKGRLVSGSFEQATALNNGKIAIKLTRNLNGNRVLDSVTVPAGNDPFGRPFRTLMHIPADNPGLQRIS